MGIYERIKNIYQFFYNVETKRNMEKKPSLEDITVRAIASKPDDPGSGKIILEGPGGYYKEIPSLIFTKEQSDSICEAIRRAEDRSYNNEKIK